MMSGEQSRGTLFSHAFFLGGESAMPRLRVAIACATLIFLCQIASGQSTTLLLDVFSPSPPITDTQPIHLRAATAELVFPDSGHDILSSFTINGFDINWEMSSYDDHMQVVVPIVFHFNTELNLGTLAPGTYNVQANWENVNAILYPGAPTSGVGSLSFTVVPEPSTLTLLGLGGFVALAVRRR
jgi:PEP-CTERM motif